MKCGGGGGEEGGGGGGGRSVAICMIIGRGAAGGCLVLSGEPLQKREREGKRKGGKGGKEGKMEVKKER